MGEMIWKSKKLWWKCIA